MRRSLGLRAGALVAGCGLLGAATLHCGGSESGDDLTADAASPSSSSSGSGRDAAPGDDAGSSSSGGSSSGGSSSSGSPTPPGQLGDACNEQTPCAEELECRDAICAAPVVDGPVDPEWAHWPMPNPSGAGLPQPASYTTTADVVTDTITGLRWQRRVELEVYTWAEARSYCASLSLGGQSNWRLPTRVELMSLVDFTVLEPAIDANAFPEEPPAPFWTGTPWVDNGGDDQRAWFVYMGRNAQLSGFIRTSGGMAARCVQGPPLDASSSPSSRYSPGPAEVTAGDTVYDAWTGLIWQRQLSPITRTWEEARSHCAGLGTGWRVPSVKELVTLVDVRRSAPATVSSVFAGVNDRWLWSSSAVAGVSQTAWAVGFEYGVAATNPRSSAELVRCVR